MVTVLYRGFDGKDHKETIRVGQAGQPAMSEEKAVEAALESLKKSQIEGAHGVFAQVPRIYDVKAKRRSSLRVMNAEKTLGFDDILNQLQRIK